MPPKKVKSQESPKATQKSAASQSQGSQGSKKSAPSQKKPAGKKATKKATVVAADTEGINSGDGLALGTALVTGLCTNANVATLVAQYINALQEDPIAACAGIISCICQASGVKEGFIDEQTLQDESNVSTALEEVFARLPTGADAVYWLIHKDAKYKKFRKAFPAFFERLMIAGFAAGVLHDDNFLPVLTPWLAAMGESKSRGFRHTASLALFAIIQGLNDRAVNLSQSLQASSKKEAPALQGKYDAVIALQSQIFSVSLHQRVKDISPEIRTLAVQSLKQYFLNAPEIYVSNNFLRYLILAFHDKKAEIRFEAVDFLVQALTSLTQYLPRMQDFIRHIAKRIVDMTADVDTKCADYALKAAALIIKHDYEQGNDASGSNFFDHEMIDTILMSIMDDRLAIRQTTGLLLKVVIRCRNAHADEAEQPKLRGQTLAYLAATLREQYKEPLAEAYLVDALWRDDDPPRLLTEYKVFLELANGEVATDAVTGVRLLTSVLLRIKGTLELGPAQKDDIKSHKKADKRTAESTQDLAMMMSKDIGGQLGSILEKHATADDMLLSVSKLICAMDLNALTTQDLSNNFRNALVALRRGTASAKAGSASANAQVINVLSELWRTVAFTEHPQKSEGDSQLHELLKQVLKQLAGSERSAKRNEGEINDIWLRVEILSTIVALNDQWGLFKAALTQHASTLANSGATPETASLLKSVVATCGNSLMWMIGAHQADPSQDQELLAANMASVATTFLSICGVESADENTLVLRCETLTRLCDIVCLPFFEMPQAEQETLVDTIAEVTDECNDVLKALYDKMKDTLQVASSSGATAAATTTVTAYRKEISLWEGRVVRLSAGVVRLFTFDRLSEQLAPKALLLWTRTPLKTASDLYKSMFHYLRDKTTGAASASAGSGAANSANDELERSIINAAYTQCAMLGVNKTALESFYQVGYKLASMHFLSTDKHYAAAVSVVKYAVDFASTTDPTILHAVAPYCSKLRQADALIIANGLNNIDIFGQASNNNAFISNFISAIRRAAKLEEGGRQTTATPARGGSTMKRARGAEAIAAAGLTGTTDPDGVMADILSGTTAGKSKKRVVPEITPARVTDAAGWRVRDVSAAAAAELATPAVTGTAATTAAAGAATKLAKTGGKTGKKAAPKPSPNTATIASMLGELDSEVFIATQEWGE